MDRDMVREVDPEVGVVTEPAAREQGVVAVAGALGRHVEEARAYTCPVATVGGYTPI